MIAYLRSVQIGASTLSGDAHTEAVDAAELVLTTEVECVCLTFVAGRAIGVFLQYH